MIFFAALLAGFFAAFLAALLAVFPAGFLAVRLPAGFAALELFFFRVWVALAMPHHRPAPNIALIASP